ncbi:MAG: ABC transporter ATP-binding protein [Deltaproteobacteria bacterium]|nr:ABC transporter ATP-binding protein [Deltaproteobacteria bacterium]
MLEIRDLDAFYGPLRALSKLSINVPHGKIVSIVGSNGAGKSSLLKCISGIIVSKEGSIKFEGQQIIRLSVTAVVRKGISLVPEGRQLFTSLSVHDNLLLGAYARFSRKNKDQITMNMNEVFDLFPRLKERKYQQAGTLSGGEQQMLSIGRALMARPKLLMLDEPSLGLAPIIVEEIFNKIVLMNETGTTILLVEQNATQALQFSHYGYVLETGHLALEGPSNKLLSDTNVVNAYLGLQRINPDPISNHQ